MTSVADKLAKKSERRTSKKQVRLRLMQVDVWSVVKLTFLLTLCLGIVTIVAAVLAWTVLANTGVMESINNLLNDVTGSEKVTVETFVNFGGVLGFSVVIAVLQVVVLTALAAVGTLLLNLACRLTGGIVMGFTNN
ncbi:DUF3566 domain-containing protein [Gulosibacter sediminis]|uniref:DUF3566 domain-containing protein n=1 Tax=Gulosibacter sediminis TaxID=1729695 RepID=UPI001867A802|nr:DUF3566 domain-containing protein [Gulosibacter sediminis]